MAGGAYQLTAELSELGAGVTFLSNIPTESSNRSVATAVPPGSHAGERIIALEALKQNSRAGRVSVPVRVCNLQPLTGTVKIRNNYIYSSEDATGPAICMELTKEAELDIRVYETSGGPVKTIASKPCAAARFFYMEPVWGRRKPRGWRHPSCRH